MSTRRQSPAASPVTPQPAERAPESQRSSGVASLCFERVLEAHGPAVLRFCAAQAGPNRTEDVFQETMIAALRSLDQVRDPGAVRSWLFAIAARKAIDSHRERARSPEPVADPEPLEVASGDDANDADAIVDDEIWSRVRELPAKQREAVALRFLGDLSHRQIAAAMQISEPAARRNVFEGLKRLRSDFDDDPIDIPDQRSSGR